MSQGPTAIIDPADHDNTLEHRRGVLSCIAAVFDLQPNLEVVYVDVRSRTLARAIRSNPSHLEYGNNTSPPPLRLAPPIPCTGSPPQERMDRLFFRELQDQLCSSRVNQAMGRDALIALCGGLLRRMTRFNHKGLIAYLTQDSAPIWDDRAEVFAQAYALEQATTPATTRSSSQPRL